MLLPLASSIRAVCDIVRSDANLFARRYSRQRMKL